jgi:hypothetical protein
MKQPWDRRQREEGSVGWHFLLVPAIFTDLQADVFTRALAPGKGFPSL